MGCARRRLRRGCSWDLGGARPAAFKPPATPSVVRGVFAVWNLAGIVYLETEGTSPGLMKTVKDCVRVVAGLWSAKEAAAAEAAK